MVRIEALSKSFEARRRLREALRHPTERRYVHAVQGVSCEIGSGEMFGLLGPNGAGKSTLFRMLATLLLPDGGRASLAGYDLVRDAKQVRGLVSLVSTDERSLNWRISARENLRFYATLFGLHGQGRWQRVDDVLDLVELADTGEKSVGTFSSGMKQRLLIARALLPRPQLLLLDEPTRSLDPIAARHFRRLLQHEIAGRQGCTVLLATHNPEEALDICGRVAILHGGRLIAVDRPDALAGLLGDARFQAWTRTPQHRAFAALASEGRIASPSRMPDEDGWAVVEFGVPGENAHSAEVLTALVCGGAEIARFQRVQPALADVIEAVMRRSAGEALSHA